jgi:hypothetical protein
MESFCYNVVSQVTEQIHLRDSGQRLLYLPLARRDTATDFVFPMLSTGTRAVNGGVMAAKGPGGPSRETVRAQV